MKPLDSARKHPQLPDSREKRPAGTPKSMIQVPDAARLRDLLWYNPISGQIMWKSSKKVAGYICARGYVKITIAGVEYQAHRIAWALFKGRWPERDIDHLDGNCANNSISNLRLCSDAENQQNRGLATNNRSGFTGVSWDSALGGWTAKIKSGGVARKLGTYATKEAAAKRYAEEKRRLHKFNPEVVVRQSKAR